MQVIDMYFQKILITTDFSPLSLQAFDLGAYTRHMEGSEIILLNVGDLGPDLVGADPVVFPDLFRSCHNSYLDRARERLAELARKHFHNENVRLEVIVSTNRAGDEICRFAEENECSLIIMASQGFTPLGAIFLGSTVQRVLQRTRIPVLVVPPFQS